MNLLSGKRTYIVGSLIVVAGIAHGAGFLDVSPEVSGGLFTSLVGLAFLFLRKAVPSLSDLLVALEGPVLRQLGEPRPGTPARAPDGSRAIAPILLAGLLLSLAACVPQRARDHALIHATTLDGVLREMDEDRKAPSEEGFDLDAARELLEQDREIVGRAWASSRVLLYSLTGETPPAKIRARVEEESGRTWVELTGAREAR